MSGICEGRVVIVTGAGRGLGRLYAMEFARRGGSVVVNDLGSTMHGAGADASVADRVVEEIARAGGVGVASHDSVATSEGGEAIVRTAVERFGRLDAVVSNAGIFQTAEFEKLAVDEWRRMLNVHLDGGRRSSAPSTRSWSCRSSSSSRAALARSRTATIPRARIATRASSRARRRLVRRAGQPAECRRHRSAP